MSDDLFPAHKRPVSLAPSPPLEPAIEVPLRSCLFCRSEPCGWLKIEATHCYQSTHHSLAFPKVQQSSNLQIKSDKKSLRLQNNPASCNQ